MTPAEFNRKAREAAKLRRRGLTVDQVAKKMGVAAPTVKQYLRAAGTTEKRRQRRQYTVEQFHAAVAAGHRTVAEVADHIGCSIRTVQLLAKEAKFDLARANPRGEARRRQVTKAVRAYMSGATIPTIAHQQGVTEATVRRYLVTAGVEEAPAAAVERKRQLVRTLWRQTRLTRQEIARAAEVDPAIVTRYLKDEPPRS